jgi:hypothetical protein
MNIRVEVLLLWPNTKASGCGMHALPNFYCETVWIAEQNIFFFLFNNWFNFCRFRKLFVVLSSYTYMNTLRKIKWSYNAEKNVLLVTCEISSHLLLFYLELELHGCTSNFYWFKFFILWICGSISSSPLPTFLQHDWMKSANFLQIIRIYMFINGDLTQVVLA